MYYPELIQKFWDFNQKAKLNTTAVAMYLYLLKLGNDSNGYEICISDVAVANILGITRKTVKPTKEKLRNFGLIQYENKIGLPCFYRLLLDYPFQISETKTTEKVKVQNPIIENSVDFPVQNIPKITEEKKEQKEEKTPKYSKTVNQPSWEEFIEYAQTLDSYETSLDSDIKEKYRLWNDNDWKNASNRPITNWKSSLKSTLPYMKSKTDNEVLSIKSIPNIKPPKPSLEKQ